MKVLIEREIINYLVSRGAAWHPESATLHFTDSKPISAAILRGRIESAKEQGNGST